MGADGVGDQRPPPSAFPPAPLDAPEPEPLLPPELAAGLLELEPFDPLDPLDPPGFPEPELPELALLPPPEVEPLPAPEPPIP
jgi:hypothetical protein